MSIPAIIGAEGLSLKNLPSQALLTVEVEEPRTRVQLGLEHEDALVLQDVAELAPRIEEVPELPGAYGAHFDTGGIAALPDALHAEGALLDDALGTRPISQ